MTPIERRKIPRKSVEKLAYLNFERQNTGGVIVDVSEAGLRFHTVSAVQHAQPVHLSLLLGAGNLIEAVGELAWLDPSRTIGGIRFTMPPEGALEQIRHWIGESALEPLRSEAAAAEQKAAFKQPWPNAAGTPSPSTWPESHGFPLIGFEPDPEERSRGSAFWRGLAGGVILSAMIAAALFFLYQRKAVNPTVQIGSEVGGTLESKPVPAPLALVPDSSARTTTAPAEPAQSPAQSDDQPQPRQPSQLSDRKSADNLTDTGPSPDATRVKSNPSPGAPSDRSARASGKPAAERTQPASGGQDELTQAREYLRGSGRSRDSTVASRLLWVAVEKGSPAAEVALADLYSRGDGITKNCEQARVLLMAASGKGDSEAMQKLRELNAKGCP